MVTAVSGTLFFNLLDDGLDVTEQNLITAEACHTVAVLLSSKEAVGFRYTVMAVAPVDDDRFRPTAPDMLHDTFQVRHDLLSGRTSAGTKDRGDQFAAQPLKDMERLASGNNCKITGTARELLDIFHAKRFGKYTKDGFGKTFTDFENECMKDSD